MVQVACLIRCTAGIGCLGKTGCSAVFNYSIPDTIGGQAGCKISFLYVSCHQCFLSGHEPMVGEESPGL